MKRILLVTFALAASPAYAASDIVLLESAPASISLSAWCRFDEACDQPVAELAQALCHIRRANAQIAGGRQVVDFSFQRGEKTIFRFNCVR
jgi:hypothetical protein